MKNTHTHTPLISLPGLLFLRTWHGPNLDELLLCICDVPVYRSITVYCLVVGDPRVCVSLLLYEEPALMTLDFAGCRWVERTEHAHVDFTHAVRDYVLVRSYYCGTPFSSYSF